MLIKGDIVNSNANIILHGCNTKGLMGAGVALAIRRKWPQNYLYYKTNYRRYRLGQTIIFHTGGSTPRYIFNGLTQKYYGRDGVYADLDAIDEVLQFTANYIRSGLTVAMPMIGCGLGGLDWEKDVKPLVDRHTPTAYVYYL